MRPYFIYTVQNASISSMIGMSPAQAQMAQTFYHNDASKAYAAY